MSVGQVCLDFAMDWLFLTEANVAAAFEPTTSEKVSKSAACDPIAQSNSCASLTNPPLNE